MYKMEKLSDFICKKVVLYSAQYLGDITRSKC